MGQFRVKTDIYPARKSHDVVKNKVTPGETLHCWQRDPISYIQSKLVTYKYNNYSNVLIPFLGRKTLKRNIYFIASSQTELEVFSLCTYGRQIWYKGTGHWNTQPKQDILEIITASLFRGGSRHHPREECEVILSVKWVSWPCKYNYSCWKWICKDTNIIKNIRGKINEKSSIFYAWRTLNFRSRADAFFCLFYCLQWSFTVFD